LIVEHSKCTGCRLCEVVCSIRKNSAANPTRARINVIKWEQMCVEIPMLCQQCEAAPCLAVCPVGALVRDEIMGRVAVNYELCIGCKFCVPACPFGAMGIDIVAKKVIKCDLCDDDPTCVKFCETKALQYVEANTANKTRMREAAERLLSSIARTSAGSQGE